MECPVCGNEGVHPAYTQNEFEEKWLIYECDSCGAEFGEVLPNG